MTRSKSGPCARCCAACWSTSSSTWPRCRSTRDVGRWRRGSNSRSLGSLVRLLVLGGLERQADVEVAAATLDALRPDAAAQALHDVLADVESEADAADAALRCVGRARKRLEERADVSGA